MESIDSAKFQRVWERVSHPTYPMPEPAVRPDLYAMAQLAGQMARDYASLARSIRGRQGQMLLQFSRQCRQQQQSLHRMLGMNHLEKNGKNR